MSESNATFVTLGRHLKYVREQSRQSLAEVSGAVEIDELTLARIESGRERPAEDILLLLISHFGVQDQEAVQLWELANYDGEMPEQIKIDSDQHLGGKPVVMLMALDMRTIYSDGLDITIGKTGVTLNFTQGVDQTKSMPVARVGMSYEQAAQVLANLQRALLQARYATGPLALPPNRLNTDTSPENKS